MQQLTVALTLLLFLTSPLLESTDPAALAWGQDTEVSFWLLEDESAAENARGRRSSKRLKRAKGSLKSLPAPNRAGDAILTAVRFGETYSAVYPSKCRVYQQINVYRI